MTEALLPEPLQAAHGAVAGHAAHALNNITGILYAALDYLEAPTDAKSAERARTAVGRACANTLALSAALSLLALGPSDSAAAGTRTPARLAAADMARIADTLHAACGVQIPAGMEADMLGRTRIDRDTLQALLVCAGTVLRHSSGAAPELRCHTDAGGGAAAERPRILFDLVTREPARAAASAASASRHPCAIALAHAPSVLAALGVRIDMAQQGAVRVVVELAGVAP
jgi:hypothetical protein